jgi:hypothetical protein
MAVLRYVASKSRGILKQYTLEVSEDDALRFYELEYRADVEKKDEYRILRRDTDDGVVISKKDYLMFKSLYAGESFRATAEKLNVNTEVVFKFCEFLLEVSFIKTIGSKQIHIFSDKIKPQLTSVPKWCFSWVLSRLVQLFYLLIVVSGLCIAAINFQFFPRVTDIFWHPSFFIVFLSLFIYGYILTFLHEVAHFIATRAVGGAARVRFLTVRFFDLILETESYHTLFMRKKYLYFIFISGMLADLLLISMSFWGLYIVNNYFTDYMFLSPLFNITIILKISGLVWQLQAYLRTDIYNCIAEYCDDQNLFNNALQYVVSLLERTKIGLLQFLWGLLKPIVPVKYIRFKSDDNEKYSLVEKRRYVIFFAYLSIGVCLYFAVFFYYVFARDFLLIVSAYSFLISGTVIEFFQALLVIGIIIFRYCFPLIIAVREKDGVYI